MNAFTSTDPEARAGINFNFQVEIPGEDDWTAIFRASRNFSYCLFCGRGSLSPDDGGRDLFSPLCSIFTASTNFDQDSQIHQKSRSN